MTNPERSDPPPADVPTGAERYLAERLADPEYRDAYEAAAPDDLTTRARRHAETHPESRELIEELLLEVTRWACMVGEASPPTGYEAVWLPGETVDEFAAGDWDEVSARHVVTACREAQAPVPPWPGAVLSGLCDEDGEPTWLAQAGQVRGEAVRLRHRDDEWATWATLDGDEWVEVRAPRAVPEPETERVQAWEAVRDGRQVVGASSPFEAHYIWRSGPGRAFIGERTMDKAVLVAPDGKVEVLKDGES